MIHVGTDVHIRNSVLNAKDADGQVLARGRASNTPPDLGEFFTPLARQAKDKGEAIRVVLESIKESTVFFAAR